MTHTPTPWHRTGWSIMCGDPNDPEIVASTDLEDLMAVASRPNAHGMNTAEDNAAFIVRAVNNHAALKDALKLAEATIQRLNRHNSANGTLDVIRAALAQ